jgi:hypothetical protein
VDLVLRRRAYTPSRRARRRVLLAALCLLVPLLLPAETFAQAAENCRPVEASTLSKWLDALGPISAAVPMLSLAVQGKWLSWDFAAALGTEIASIYNTWFKDKPTAYDCTIPREQIGAGAGGSVRLVATDDAIRRVTDSTGQINYQLLNRTVQQEYARLGPLPPGGGPGPRRVPCTPRRSPIEGSRQTIRRKSVAPSRTRGAHASKALRSSSGRRSTAMSGPLC